MGSRVESLLMWLDRKRRWVAPAVLIACFIATQALFRLPRAGLVVGRWLLTPHMLVAAAVLWPVWLARRAHAAGGAGGTGGAGAAGAAGGAGGAATVAQTAGASVLSLLTVVAGLFAIPLWAGHGCWAPDLQSLVLMAVAGVILALVLPPLVAARMGRLSERRRGAVALVFLASFTIAVAVSLLSARAAMPARPSGQPRPVWSRTPWQAVWAYAAPQPWSKASFAPADLAVEGEVLVFVPLPRRAEVLDARDGRLLWTAVLDPDRIGLPYDTARNIWERPVVSSGHVLLRPRGGQAGHILDLDERTLDRVDLADASEVVPCPEGGFYLLTSGDLRRLDAHGRPVWAARRPAPSPGPGQTPGSPAPSADFVEFRVNEASPPGMSPRVVATPNGVVAWLPECLYVCDQATGTIRWHTFPRGRFAGMVVSPARDTIYTAEAGPEGRYLSARGLDGRLLWSRRLPDDSFGLEWAATPYGLGVVILTQDGGPIHHLGPDGSPQYAIAVPAGERYRLRAYRDVLLLTSNHRISARRAADGGLLWELDPSRLPPSLPAGFHDYQDWVLTGETLLIPCGAGIVACNLHTGNLLWQYYPPGYISDLAAAGDLVYVASSRGIFAVPALPPVMSP